MNKRLFLFCLFLTSLMIACSDDEPEWNAEEVCPEAGINIYGMPNRGTFTDERDGQVYRYTTIGNQVWMAENLRYDAPYSMCCNDEKFVNQYCTTIELDCESESCCRESMCNLFGRYYSIIENGKEMGLIDRALADTICPKGWHIPSKEEWEKLNDAMKVDGETDYDVANKIKHSDSIYFSISSSPEYYPNVMLAGTDDCALGVISSGSLYGENKADKIGAFFLTSTQKNEDFIYVYGISGKSDISSFYGYRTTIRCVMD